MVILVAMLAIFSGETCRHVGDWTVMFPDIPQIAVRACHCGTAVCAGGLFLSGAPCAVVMLLFHMSRSRDCFDPQASWSSADSGGKAIPGLVCTWVSYKVATHFKQAGSTRLLSRFNG